MDNKPVNNIETNGNLIRVNDRTSEIQLTLKDINGNDAKLTDKLTYFYLTNDNKHLYKVTDYSIDNNIITFKMPPVPRGLFRIEIKDSNGIIYPSGDDVEITVKISLEEGINTAYFTYQDIVTSHVEKTALKYIDEHPEKFKGQDGKDGIDGKDGKDGLNGRNGKDGIDGKDGLNGIDGQDGKDGEKGEKGDKGDKGEKGDKGDKGEKGEKGDTGTLANEKIGLVNKIDLTKLSPRSSTSNIEFDLDNGIVNYSNVEWYLSQYVVLNGVKHVFRIEDFLSNPNYSSGRINLQMFDSNSKLIINTFVTPKKIVEVDLTGRDRQEYWLQLRVTNTELFSGFIEKPMLVEGETPVLWNMSEKDRSIYLESLKKSNYHLASIPNQDITGTLSNPNIVNLTNKTTDSTQNVTDNQIYLTKGIWLITLNTYISPNNYSGVVIFYLFLNETQINITQLQNNQHKIKSYSHVIKVDNNALFSLRSSKTSDEETISFQGSSQNNLTLTKLGGV